MASSKAEVSSPTRLTEAPAVSSESDEISVEIIKGDHLPSDIGGYEEMFKGRYTDEDESYIEGIKKSVTVPPLVHPWYNKPKRNFDYGSTRRRGSGDHRGHRGRWSGNQGHHQGRHAGNNNYYKDQQQRPNRDNRYQPY